jgi:hypothetical protein
MADGQLKLSRRALLGVVCAGPGLGGVEGLLRAGRGGVPWDNLCVTFGAADPSAAPHTLRFEPSLSRAASRDREAEALRTAWARALALFNRADATVTALEGTRDDDAFNRAADAHDRALERLLLAPAPTVAALAEKLRLAPPRSGLGSSPPATP